MAVSDQARRNHDELFPRHVSTLAVTDPELIEAFDNFAFDEVLQHGGLDTRRRLMVQLACMVAGQALAEYRVMLGAALTVGSPPWRSRRSSTKPCRTSGWRRPGRTPSRHAGSPA